MGTAKLEENVLCFFNFVKKSETYDVTYMWVETRCNSSSRHGLTDLNG